MNITQQELLDLFEYDNGKLYRKVKTTNNFPAGKEAGYFHKSAGYRNVGINKEQYRTHRIIFMMHHGFVPEFIDHINNDKLDNRIENLRPATRRENNSNVKMRKDNTSGIKGVAWYPITKRWTVQIQHNRKKIRIGYFKDIELAELVAIEARDKYHGKFANHG